MPDFRHGCVTRRRMAFLSQISVSMLYEKTLCEKVVCELRFVLKRAVLKQARTRETPGLNGIADTCYTSSMPSLIGSKGIGAPFRQLKTLRDATCGTLCLTKTKQAIHFSTRISSAGPRDKLRCGLQQSLCCMPPSTLRPQCHGALQRETTAVVLVKSNQKRSAKCTNSPKAAVHANTSRELI